MIRVLIVDDSAVVRKLLAEELSSYDDIEVVGSAVDPYAARDKIVQLQPDVLTLDLEMPRMDGLTFLTKLMKYYPIPVVVVSSLTPQNSPTALRALELGAVEVISKPGSQYSVPNRPGQLARAVRAAASARVMKPLACTVAESDLRTPRLLDTTHKILAIGASTGGTQAIEVVVRQLPVTAPGTVIVQHMPEHFTAAFAERLNKVSPMEVREARDNDFVVPGTALVAPGNHHMTLQLNGARYQVRIKDGPPVHHQRPAVDVLFYSVARYAGRNAVGVLLTGMGADGAKGLLAMREAGAHTVVQDEKTCVVFGMPKEAIKFGAACEVVPLPQVATTVLERFKK
jgi:two-component system, chemotaxis family, protein-glutamate methylesterase/glutaminase